MVKTINMLTIFFMLNVIGCKGNPNVEGCLIFMEYANLVVVEFDYTNHDDWESKVHDFLNRNEEIDSRYGHVVSYINNFNIHNPKDPIDYCMDIVDIDGCTFEMTQVNLMKMTRVPRNVYDWQTRVLNFLNIGFSNTSNYVKSYLEYCVQNFHNLPDPLYYCRNLI